MFEQYSQYETFDIILEITAVIFGLLSVWYSKNNNILFASKLDLPLKDKRKFIKLGLNPYLLNKTTCP